MSDTLLCAPDVYPRRLRLSEFRAWLESLEPTEPVGRRGSAYSCPLATWSGRLITGDIGPLWCRRFAELVDRGGPDGEVVTAGEALVYLAMSEYAFRGRFDRRRFRRLLESLPHDAKVGFARQGECCPLAQWVQLGSDTFVIIREDGLYDSHGHRVRRLPLWVRQFIHTLDNHPLWDTDPDTPWFARSWLPVTAGLALEVLDLVDAM